MELLSVVQAGAAALASQDGNSYQFTVIEFGVMMALIAQTGMFFYWGGQVKRAIAHLESSQRDIIERLTVMEREGSPLAKVAAEAVDKEFSAVEQLRQRLENHIAALGTIMVRLEVLERSVPTRLMKAVAG